VSSSAAREWRRYFQNESILRLAWMQRKAGIFPRCLMILISAIEPKHEKQACSHARFFFKGFYFFRFACRRQALLRFPPNACRGERCGVWGRTSPIKLVEVALERVESGAVIGNRVLVGMQEFPAFAGTASGLQAHGALPAR